MAEDTFSITLVFMSDMDETWQCVLEIVMVTQAML